MEAHVNDTRARLGELAAMAHQTQEAERRILARATERLDEVQSELKDAGAQALSGGGDKYMDLIKERGQLQQVIAQAQQHLRARPE